MDFVRSLVIPGFEDLLKMLSFDIPIFVVIGIVWAYFSSLPKDQRSIRAAARQVFPLSDYRSVTSRSDLASFLAANLLIIPILSVLASLFATVVSAQIVRDLLVRDFGEWGSAIPASGLIIGVQATFMILSEDFGEFVAHYMAHKVPFLWSLHRVHHSSESLIFFTLYRTHPIEFLIDFAITVPVVSGVITGIVLYFTKSPLDPLAVAIYGNYFFLSNLRAMLQHSRVHLSLGWLNRIFAAPLLHQMHHSAEPRHREINFASNFTLWDWMFGTLYLPQRNEKWRTGLNEHELGASNPHARVWNLFFEPVGHMFGTLFGRVRAASTRQSPGNPSGR